MYTWTVFIIYLFTFMVSCFQYFRLNVNGNYIRKGLLCIQSSIILILLQESQEKLGRECLFVDYGSLQIQAILRFYNHSHLQNRWQQSGFWPSCTLTWKFFINFGLCENSEPVLCAPLWLHNQSPPWLASTPTATSLRNSSLTQMIQSALVVAALLELFQNLSMLNLISTSTLATIQTINYPGPFCTTKRFRNSRSFQDQDSRRKESLPEDESSWGWCTLSSTLS